MKPLIQSGNSIPDRKIRRGAYSGLLTFALISFLQANNLKLPKWLSPEMLILTVAGAVSYATRKDMKDICIPEVLAYVASQVEAELVSTDPSAPTTLPVIVAIAKPEETL